MKSIIAQFIWQDKFGWQVIDLHRNTISHTILIKTSEKMTNNLRVRHQITNCIKLYKL
jgi:hypothetical protein